MQGKSTKECGIKIYTYIYPLFFLLSPGRGRRCQQPRPGIALHGTTPKRGTVAQAEKLREKWGLKAADFSPSRVRRGCASRGLRGLRPELCPPEPYRTVPALHLLCPGTPRVPTPCATRVIRGRRGRDAGFSPHTRWKSRMFFFPVKLSY